jgi:hypothetical protein
MLVEEYCVMAGSAGRRFELSPRDQAVLTDLTRLRLLTGAQLERLHFAGFTTANSRGSSRRRALGRLQKLGLITSLERRVGGVRAGSTGLIYTLDAAGQHLLQQCAARPSARPRKPWPLGWLFTMHTLDVAELYVRLRELERLGQLELLQYLAEPASWHRTATGTAKPDAFLIYGKGPFEEHVWLEVDRGTESLNVVRRKLAAYVDLALTGDSGPSGVFPKVVVTTPTEQRREALASVIRQLPDPAGKLVAIELFDVLFRSAARPPPA